MPGISQADYAVCERRALAPGCPFLVSRRFVSSDFADQLLAMRAFFSMVRSIPAEVSEPSVGVLKLAWLQREMRGEALRITQHPVVRAMRDSGALQAMDEDSLERYFVNVKDFMCTDTYQDESGLFDLAKGIGGQEALLECGSEQGSYGDAAVTCIGAGSFLFQAIRNPRMRRCSESWWVPLNLQASFGVIRHSAGSGQEDPARRDLLVALGKLAMEWIDTGTGNLARTVPSKTRHILIHAALERRQLVRMLSRPEKFTEQTAASPAIGDAFLAWNTARKLNSAKS